jgi:WD40 repeat protein
LVELLLHKFLEGSVVSVAFSPDGSRLVSGSLDNTIRLWDASTGAEIRRLGGHIQPVTQVAMSDDGATIASTDMSGDVLLWNVATGERLPSDEGARDLLEQWLALSPPMEPTRIEGIGAVILAGEAEWRLARREQVRSPERGPSPALARILDRWERDIGLRVDPERGNIETIPMPGPAYADTPYARFCK